MGFPHSAEQDSILTVTFISIIRTEFLVPGLLFYLFIFNKEDANQASEKLSSSK